MLNLIVFAINNSLAFTSVYKPSAFNLEFPKTSKLPFLFFPGDLQLYVFIFKKSGKWLIPLHYMELNPVCEQILQFRQGPLVGLLSF